MNNLQKFQPQNLGELMEFADRLSKSSLVPKDFKGKAGDLLVAMQLGSELGLAPLQSVQNIAVINGRPCVWGDALLALVQGHHDFEDIQETFDNNTAICIVKRKGRSPVKAKFSVDDAKKARLWGKAGPWTNYPQRMLQLRARGFALRDAFSDALKGIITREEVNDYQPIKVESKSTNEKVTALIEEIDSNKNAEVIIKDVTNLSQNVDNTVLINEEEGRKSLESSSTLTELKEKWQSLPNHVKNHLLNLKDELKEKLENKESSQVKQAEIKEDCHHTMGCIDGLGLISDLEKTINNKNTGDNL